MAWTTRRSCRNSCPREGGHITRLEILQHQLLYAIQITPPKDHGFNLCPADICQVETAGTAQARGLAGPDPVAFEVCPVKPAMQIEATTAPAEVVAQALAISRAAGLDVCGIEFLIDQRDGRHYFYDVNALSNFVTDAPVWSDSTPSSGWWTPSKPKWPRGLR